MTREDIARMAREAGIQVAENNSFADDMYISVLYHFAHLVAEREREACARDVDVVLGYCLLFGVAAGLIAVLM